MNLFIKMSFFHYNIAKAFFAIILKGTEYGRSEKSTVLRRILILLYIAIKKLTFYKKLSVIVCTAFAPLFERIKIVICFHIECS